MEETLSFQAGRSGERPAYCALLRRQHGGYFGATDSLPQLRCDQSMATQAQGADVIQVALPAAFRHRQNVIGIPQTLAHASVQSPVSHQGHTCIAARSLQPAVLFDRVQPAMSANASVALQNLLP